MGRGAGVPSRLSVIVTTYRRPRELELVLEGYARQDDGGFEVVVADDGSGGETAETVARVAEETGLPSVHVWHPDRGFRKTEILNRALRETSGDYLVFSDGDCIPRADFVRTHRELARPDRYLSGGYIRLLPSVSGEVSVEDVRTGRLFEAGWLRERDQRLGRRRLRLLSGGPWSTLLDVVTPTRATFNGMNSSVWREAAVEVDGFDLDFTYGGLDREFGERLRNLGLKGRQVRHRAVVVHLHHERPYRDAEVQARQKRALGDLRESGRLRPARGLSELDDTVETRVRRYGRGVAA